MIVEKKKKPRKPCYFISAFLVLILSATSAYADTCAKNLMPPFTSAQALELCATFVGTATISSTLTPGTDNAYDLGTSTKSIRSAYIGTSILFGNVSGTPAVGLIKGGSGAGSHLRMQIAQATAQVQILDPAGTPVVAFNSAGAQTNLVGDLTLGNGNAIYSTSGTGPKLIAATVLTPSADFTPVAGSSITNRMNRVVAGAPTANFVSLPAATPNVGEFFGISNESANPVAVLPAGADTLQGRAAATPFSCAANTACYCNAFGTGAWGCK